MSYDKGGRERERWFAGVLQLTQFLPFPRSFSTKSSRSNHIQGVRALSIATN
jgi:hypothetical protein